MRVDRSQGAKRWPHRFVAKCVIRSPDGSPPVGVACVTGLESAQEAATARSDVQPAAGTFGSRGSPRTFSPTMLRWIWLVPPQMVSDREKKNADIIWLTG